MEIQKIKAIIEAVLFASGRIVTEEELVLALEIDKKQIVITDNLSSIGMFYVDVVLHKKVICKLRVELKSK